MRTLFTSALLLLFTSIAIAENPPPRVQDEGGSLAPYFNLNCVGAGVSCAVSGITATLTASGTSPGGSDEDLQYNNGSAFGGTTGLHWDDTNSYLQFDDSVEAVFGTGDDATIYYDGTDLIINSTAVGTGVTRLKADSSGDIVLDRIGLGGSVISGSYYINLVQSGNARGAMSFDYTTTGTNILSDLFLKVTSQRTNNSSNYAILTQTIKNEDKQSTYYGASFTFGTAGAQAIATAGTVTFVGVNVDHSLGVGGGNSNGDIRQYGLRIIPFTAYTGVASQIDWGIYSGEDVSIASNKLLLLEGSATTKGDTYLSYTVSTTSLDTVVDGTLMQQMSGSGIGFYGEAPTAQYATTGTVSMPVAGGSGKVFDDSEFDGGYGSISYTIDDIVLALKLIGIMAK